MSIVVVLTGECDLSNLGELRRDLTPLREQPDIIFDCTKVTFLDAASIGEFVAFHKARTARGFARETILIKGGSPIERLLSALRLDELFTIVPRENVSTIDSAVRHYALRYAGPERRRFYR